MTDRVAQTRAKINPLYRADEAETVETLLESFSLSAKEQQQAASRAAQWIAALRAQPSERTLLEDFMQRYSLSTPEGVALMAMAECFLRIPDSETADRAIVDKITQADWDTAAVEGEKLLTKLSGWGLNFSEELLKSDNTLLGKMAKRLSLPVIRQAMAQAIKMLGGQFVCGQDIGEAIANANTWKEDGYTLFSYDMLGEGARTAEAAAQYFNHYKAAIEAVGKTKNGDSISVKLSALHPRYEELQKPNCFSELTARVLELAQLAKKYDMILTVDAEEADRLELSLDIFEAVFRDKSLDNYHGFGLAVQAYQKRSTAVIDWLIVLARDAGKRIPVRLVKGAYWDTEIKRAQERGLSGYPVFTRKVSTDLSYLVAAEKMLAAPEAIYAAFATHNAYTIGVILELAARHDNEGFEFQRLHGMGENLYRAAGSDKPCRVYAPVGVYRDLLPYLVRRLLENGANSSFVNRLYDPDVPVEKLVENPVDVLRASRAITHPRIPLPAFLYPGRLNPIAPDLSDRADRAALLSAIKKIPDITFTPAESAAPIMEAAHRAFPAWNIMPAHERVAILEKIADLFAERRDELIALCVSEGKKTLADAIAEWREAIDFCRYYAQQAQRSFGEATLLPGPTGEENTLHAEGRGVFVCISPWNFPLAIFTGQVVAALVTGNCVVAKPAEQTPKIAAFAVELMHKAGVPKDVLQLAVGSGGKIGAALVAHPLTAGVAFTGSTETAWTIQKSLAEKRGPIVPFIAETGGQNVMIVDSSALPEQVVDDTIRSAFHSAGQRCSALRVLCLQKEIALDILKMLDGAMQELFIGNPARPETDIPPVIDDEAREALERHATALKPALLAAASAPQKSDESFVVPRVFRINALSDLTREHFGPLLHVLEFDAEKLDELIDDIHRTGYGLTLGIHSRIESHIQHICVRARVGNLYVNRGMTGAVVGVQPFGGMGLSGTGPKAGGPHYLSRFVTEKTISVNITASGGNMALAVLDDPQS